MQTCSHSTEITCTNSNEKKTKRRRWQVPVHVSSLRERCAELEERNGNLLDCLLQFHTRANQVADSIDSKDHRVMAQDFVEQLNTALAKLKSSNVNVGGSKLTGNYDSVNSIKTINSVKTATLKSAEPQTNDIVVVNVQNNNHNDKNYNNNKLQADCVGNEIKERDNTMTNVGDTNSKCNNVIHKTSTPVTTGVIVSGTVVKEISFPSNLVNAQEDDKVSRAESVARLTTPHKASPTTVVVSGTVIAASPLSKQVVVPVFATLQSKQKQEHEKKEKKECEKITKSDLCAVLTSILVDLNKSQDFDWSALSFRLLSLQSAEVSLTSAEEQMSKLVKENGEYRASINKLQEELRILQDNMLTVPSAEVLEMPGQNVPSSTEQEIRSTTSTNKEELQTSQAPNFEDAVKKSQESEQKISRSNQNSSSREELVELYLNVKKENIKLTDDMEKLTKENEELEFALSQLDEEREALQKEKNFLEEKSNQMEGQLQRLLSSQVVESAALMADSISHTKPFASSSSSSLVSSARNARASRDTKTHQSTSPRNEQIKNCNNSTNYISNSDNSTSSAPSSSFRTHNNSSNIGKNDQGVSKVSDRPSSLQSSVTISTTTTTTTSSPLSSSPMQKINNSANTSPLTSSSATSTPLRGAIACSSSSLLAHEEKELVHYKAIIERLNNEVKRRAQRCSKLDEVNAKLSKENNELKISLLQYQRQVNDNELALERETEMIENERRVHDLERELAKVRLSLHDRVSAIKSERDKMESELNFRTRCGKVYERAVNSLLRRMLTNQINEIVRQSTLYNGSQNHSSVIDYNNNKNSNLNECDSDKLKENDSFAATEDNKSDHDAFESKLHSIRMQCEEECNKLKRQHKVELTRLEFLNRELRVALSTLQEQAAVQNKEAELLRTHSSKSFDSNFSAYAYTNNNNNNNSNSEKPTPMNSMLRRNRDVSLEFESGELHKNSNDNNDNLKKNSEVVSGNLQLQNSNQKLKVEEDVKGKQRKGNTPTLSNETPVDKCAMQFVNSNERLSSSLTSCEYSDTPYATSTQNSFTVQNVVADEDNANKEKADNKIKDLVNDDDDDYDENSENTKKDSCQSREIENKLNNVNKSRTANSAETIHVNDNEQIKVCNSHANKSPLINLQILPLSTKLSSLESSQQKLVCSDARYDPEHASLTETVQVENEILLKRIAEMQQENWTLSTRVDDLQHECHALEDEIKRNATTMNLLLQSGVVSPAAVQKGTKEGQLRSLQHLLHDALKQKMQLEQELSRVRKTKTCN